MAGTWALRTAWLVLVTQADGTITPRVFTRMWRAVEWALATQAAGYPVAFYRVDLTNEEAMPKKMNLEK